MNPNIFLPLLALAGCDPWPSTTDSYMGSLWSTSIVTLDDGVYARLPQAGSLVRIGTDQTWQLVDLRGAEPLSIRPDAGKNRLLVHAQWPVCDDQDSSIKLVGDCPESALSYRTELAIIDNGRRTATASIPTHMNAMTFTPDGTTALAFMDDASDSTTVSGPIVDLSEVILLDLDSGDTTSVSVGFMPKNILFTADGQRAVIMSRSKVVVMDLESKSITVEYPLTLDADIEIDPSAAVLTPDERYVLIAIEGTKDLYKLDLEVVSIDMEALDSSPSDMSADAENDQTVLVYRDRAQVDVITEHDFIERTTIELDDPATDIAMGAGTAVLYNATNNSVRDIVLLNLGDHETTEYVASNPVDSLQLSPEGDYAVATLKPSSSNYGTGLDAYQRSRWGLAVADLLSNDIVSLVLESRPIGLEMVQTDEGAFALLLLSGFDSLIQVDLSAPGNYRTIELPAEPAGIDASPNGGFTIAHNSALGQISFLDPATGSINTTSGFATAGWMDEDTLPRRDSE